jgi:hypothetical protein
MADTIQELTGCTREEAEESLLAYKEVWLAVDALLKKPASQGDKYIPEKPKIDDGLTEEQRALCERGRWLQERVNAVFSVAHSKIQTQQAEQAPVASLEQQSLEMPLLQAPSVELQQDADEQTIPPIPQSDLPL